MKKNFTVFLALVIAVLALFISIGSLTGWVNARSDQQTSRATVPSIVSYQGQIWEGETPYDGIGYFKFAIMDGSGTTQIWSNDGEDPPALNVPLDVQNGLFTIMLGDTSLTGMTVPLQPVVFYGEGRQIRVWFSSDKVTFTQMPDQVIASVPYALSAASAANADSLGGYEPKDFQLVVTGTCPVGEIIQSIGWDGSVVCYKPPTFTITKIDEGDYNGRQPSIAIGSDGFGLIVFDDRAVDVLKVAHCEDKNCTNATITILDDIGSDPAEPSLAIGSDGLGLISYWDGTDVKVAHCSNLACTEATISTLTTGDYYVFGLLSTAISTDGFGVISYTIVDESVSYIQIAYCSNFDCSKNTITTLSSTSGAIFTSMAIGGDGYPLISYRDPTFDHLRVVHCEDLYCTASSNHIIDNYASLDAFGIDVVIGEDGLGIISYVDSNSKALKVVNCKEPDCVPFSISFVDKLVLNNLFNYTDTSIALGRDGLPIIVYYTDTLKIAHCGDTSCRSANISALPNSDNRSYPAIIIGADGFGLIASAEFQGLSVLHCSNELCIPIDYEETP